MCVNSTRCRWSEQSKLVFCVLTVRGADGTSRVSWFFGVLTVGLRGAGGTSRVSWCFWCVNSTRCRWNEKSKLGFWCVNSTRCRWNEQSKLVFRVLTVRGAGGTSRVSFLWVC